MDLVMQSATQPHAHRVWKYFQERQQWHDVFPADFADDSEEVGPYTGEGAALPSCTRNAAAAALYTTSPALSSCIFLTKYATLAQHGLINSTGKHACRDANAAAFSLPAAHSSADSGLQTLLSSATSTADSEGPCLVLFKNVHITPEQLDAWLLRCFVGRVCMRVFWLERSTAAAAGSW